MKKLLWAIVVLSFVSISVNAQSVKYPKIVENNLVLQGDKCSWDADIVHTLSIVEVNKDGYKYWGYYGLDNYENSDLHARKCGLVRSNDLENWEKYEYNPVVNSNCRWPTVVYANGVFYMFYAEYKKANGDSRIVLKTSTNGIDFNNKQIVIPYATEEQNQNPFIYFNKSDSQFYLFYYKGTEHAKTNKRWNIMVKKSNTPEGIIDTKSKTVLTSEKTMAAPSIAYYNDKYFLLVEEFNNYKNRDRWVTNAFWSDKIDEGFKRVDNNPVLANNDACAFQYKIGGKLYVTYSHATNLSKNMWVMKMIKLK